MPNDRMVYKSQRPASITKPKRPSWRTLPDDVILRMSMSTWKTAESLHPDDSTMFRAACGEGRAKAICTAWQPTYPVIVLAIGLEATNA